MCNICLFPLAVHTDFDPLIVHSDLGDLDLFTAFLGIDFNDLFGTSDSDDVQESSTQASQKRSTIRLEAVDQSVEVRVKKIKKARRVVRKKQLSEEEKAEAKEKRKEYLKDYNENGRPKKTDCGAEEGPQSKKGESYRRG